MQRRQFLIGMAAIGTVGAGSMMLARTLGAHPLAVQSSAKAPDLRGLLLQLKALQGKRLISHGVWSPTEIFQHLAQSVRGSYQGYPQMQSAWFRETVGPLAFEFFQLKGQMYHSLSAPIPGMPAFISTESVEHSLATLIAVLEEFFQVEQLFPHFAYGELSAQEYQTAHLLHIQQHLTELTLAVEFEQVFEAL